MSDALKLALTITAADMASGVLRRLRDRIAGTGEAARRVQKDFDRMVASINQGVKALAVTGYVVAKLRPGVRAASELQGELIGVRAELSGAGADAAELAKHLAEVRKTAFTVQASTPFDMGQVVALEKEIIKAGARVQDVIGERGAAAAAAALAVYEQMEPVLAGTALISIGTPFQVAADGYADLADQISRAASASSVGAAEIAETAKYAAGPLAALGRSTEEMLALSAVMAQVGVVGSMAGTSLRTFFGQAAKQKALTDANGNLLATAEIIERLRKRTTGMGDAERGTFLQKVFGERGASVALALLNEGKGSYEEIVEAMRDALPLQEKLRLQMEGYGRQLDALGGLGQSTLAILFEPALRPLTALVEKTNEWIAALGRAALENESIGKAISYGGLGLAAGIGAYGIAKVAQGGAAGLRVLKGLKGVGSAAAGIATGKAVEAATGVTPVFVTNWPASTAPALGAAADIATAGAAARTPAIFSKAKTTAALLAATPLSKLSMLGAGAIGTAAAGVVAAGGAGYGIGTLINRYLLTDQGPLGTEAGRAIGERIGAGIAHALAFFGHPSARDAIAATRRAEAMRGEVVVRVRPERGAEARAERARSDSPAMGLEAEVETGLRTGGAW